MPSRRRFLQQFAAMVLFPSSVLPEVRKLAGVVRGRNDLLRYGIIGCGERGHELLRHLSNFNNLECIAICDVDDSQIARTLRVLESCGMSFPATRTRDFREVVALPKLDAVYVATPDHWLALPAIAACGHGVDVYLESPGSRTIEELRAIAQAARQSGRIVQVGLQWRSAAHVQNAIRHIQSGELGRIRQARAWAYLNEEKALPDVPEDRPPFYVDYDFWLGPAVQREFTANRYHSTYRWFWDYAGGALTSSGAHLLDIAFLALNPGPPERIFSTGGKFGFPGDGRETPDTQQAIWTFPGLALLWEHAAGLGAGLFGRASGISFHGSNGVLVLDESSWEVYPETKRGAKGELHYAGMGIPRTFGERDASLLHIGDFIESVRSRRSPSADVTMVEESLVATHLGNLAYRMAEEIRWPLKSNPDERLKKYLSANYRTPWTLSNTGSLK